MSDLNELYQELILDHARHPHHFGELPYASHSARGINPICSDEISLSLLIENAKVVDVKFKGEGCALSMASASIMSLLINGKSYEEIEKLFNDFQSLLTLASSGVSLPTELQAFSNVSQYPMRVKCVILAWHTLKAALNKEQYPISTEASE